MGGARAKGGIRRRRPTPPLPNEANPARSAHDNGQGQDALKFDRSSNHGVIGIGAVTLAPLILDQAGIPAFDVGQTSRDTGVLRRSILDRAGIPVFDVGKVPLDGRQASALRSRQGDDDRVITLNGAL